MKTNNQFGFVTLIGSVIMLLIDPRRRNNTRYLQPKYNKLNQIIGYITLIIVFLILMYYLILSNTG